MFEFSPSNRIETYLLASSRLVLGFLMIAIAACQNPGDNSQSSNGSQQSSDSTAKQQQAQDQNATPTTGNKRLDSLNKLLEEEGLQVDALEERARIRMQRGDRRNALFDLQQALTVDSTDAAVLHTLGELRLENNQTRQAKDNWKRCARTNPDETDCRLSLGKLYYTVAVYDEALKYLNQVIEKDPYRAEAFFYKGLIARDDRKDTAKALQFIQTAIQLKDEYVEALDLMGVLLSSQEDTLAPYYYKQVLDLQPNRADIYYKLGVHYMNLDELNRAIENYTKATEIDPKHADSYYNLGYIFIQLKEYQDARDYFTQAINAKPRTNFKAYYGRAYSQEMLGDVINARKDYQKALEIIPGYEPAREGLRRINK